MKRKKIAKQTNVLTMVFYDFEKKNKKLQRLKKCECREITNPNWLWELSERYSLEILSVYKNPTFSLSTLKSAKQNEFYEKINWMRNIDVITLKKNWFKSAARKNIINEISYRKCHHLRASMN